MRKKWKPTPCDKIYGKVLDLDMFGEQINFNIHGRTHYDTCCGVICTIMILLITVIFGIMSATRAMTEHDVPVVQHQVKREYFSPGRDTYQVRQDSDEEPFAFAIALTSPTGYKKPKADVEDAILPAEEEEPVIDESMSFKMRYLISGDEDADDGK